MTIITIMAVGVALAVWCVYLERKLVKLEKTFKEYKSFIEADINYLLTGLTMLQNETFIQRVAKKKPLKKKVH